MIKEFEVQLLAFLARQKDCIMFLPLLDRDIFNFTEFKGAFDIVKDYQEKYKRLGSEADLLQHLYEFNETKPLSNTTFDKLALTIKLLFKSRLDANPDKFREKIVEHCQFRQMANLVTEYAPRLKDGIEIYREMRRGMDKVIALEERLTNEVVNPGRWVFSEADFGLLDPENSLSHPTRFHAINDLMTTGGIMSPELIIFLAEQKFGKTMFLLDMALWYACNGLPVYYADGENGENALQVRYYQAILKCPEAALFDMEQRELLTELIRWNKLRGGDIRLKNFPANVTCMNDITVDLEEQEEKTGIKFKGIIYDYLDLWKANDVTARKDKRINIQHVYHDAIRLQNSKEMFGISISQINRDARITERKKYYTEEDPDEDFAKTKNCHAMYGLVQTPKEALAGVVRAHVVCQRRGKKVGNCYMTINRETGDFVEIDKERAIRLVEEVD